MLIGPLFRGPCFMRKKSLRQKAQGSRLFNLKGSLLLVVITLPLRGVISILPLAISH